MDRAVAAGTTLNERLIDSQSKKVREVLSVAPNKLGLGVTRSRDDRLIYLSLVTTEADIWMMTLE